MRRDDILTAIHSLAEERTPEWRFDPDNPDAGSAFAMTFAEMLDDTYQKIRRLPEKHHIELLNAAGLPLAQRQAASGVVAFALAKGAEEGCLAEAGTPVYTDDGVVYTTDHPVYVAASQLKQIYCTQNDHIYRSGGDVPFTLFDQGEDLQFHGLYLGHDWLPDTDSPARFDLRLTGEHIELLAAPDAVRWQYYTGEWLDFDGADLSEDLVFTMTAQQPLQLLAVDGAERYWLRCLPLSAKAAAVRIHSADLCVNALQPCAFQAYCGDTELEAAVFYPFGKSLTAYAECLIACHTAFGKKGAVIRLDFDLEDMVQDIQNPLPEMPVQWRRVMRKQELSPPPVYDAKLERITVEYWNGQDFVRLGVRAERLLSDAPQSSRRSLCFRCPEDMQPAVMQGINSRWLRLRALEVSNAYKPNTRHIVPRISGLTLRYHYEDTWHPCSLAAWNNGRRSNPCIPFDFSYSDGCAVYFGFDKPFGGSPIGIFWNTEGTASPRELRWSIFTGGAWTAVTAAGHFWQSGLTTLFPPWEMEAQECFGETLYWLRAELDGEALAPVRILDMRLGAVTATQKTPVCVFEERIGLRDTAKRIPLDTEAMTDVTIDADISREAGRSQWVSWQQYGGSHRVTREGIEFDERALSLLPRYGNPPALRISCRFTGGEAGNCPAGSICRMDRSIGYIASVTNPAPMTGGKSAETAAEYALRGAGKLMHRGLAVTVRDFEALSMEVAGDIVKCRAVAGVNAVGLRQSGAVTVVCLPTLRGDMTPLRCDRLREYLAERTVPGVSVCVREAVYADISVWVRIRTDSPRYFTLREDIEDKLAAFLHPVTGNFQKSGYAIGEMPNHDRIVSFLMAIPRVSGIEGFTLDAAGAEDLPCPAFAVPISGKHHIEVVNIP